MRGKRKEDTHHFYFPKKIYRKWGIRNRIIKLDYELHHNLHNFYMKFCKQSEERKCHRHGYCQFSTMCCYWRSQADFGERVL